MSHSPFATLSGVLNARFDAHCLEALVASADARPQADDQARPEAGVRS